MASKLQPWIDKLCEVVERKETSLLTDNELYYIVNEEVEDEFKISLEYFNRLKVPNQKSGYKSISNIKTLPEEAKIKFIEGMATARARQKIELTKKALDNPSQAYPYFWILERKNKDLQLGKNTNDSAGNVTLNITVGHPEDKGIIDDILSGSTLDIEHEEIDDQKLLNDGESV